MTSSLSCDERLLSSQSRHVAVIFTVLNRRSDSVEATRLVLSRLLRALVASVMSVHALVPR